MRGLEDKVEDALNEGRILVLGVEVLIGFEYSAYFQSTFGKLPEHAQLMRAFSLGFMLLALAFLITPVSYHQIVAVGRDTRAVHRFTTFMIGLALAPFALGIGLDFLVTFELILGMVAGIVAGLAALAFALFFWYGLELITRWLSPRRKEKVRQTMDDNQQGVIPLEDRIRQILTEDRVVIPGIQAILGFQLTVVLTSAFERLPLELKATHLFGLVMITISTILLMAPAAYHRIVEEGDDTLRFLRFASSMVLGGMFFLAIGLASDFLVIVNQVTRSRTTGLMAAILALAGFLYLWFGYPLLRRQRSP